MGGILAVGAVALLFLGVNGLAERSKAGWGPIALLAVALGAAAFELTRFAHGHEDELFAVAYVAAPIAAIFGAALWGSRKFYGWPDLGPTPGRLAAVAAAVLVGVLIGTRVRETRDVPETRLRAEMLRSLVMDYRESHAGRWPESLVEAALEPPKTALGSVSPPPFSYEVRDPRAVIAFPLASGKRMELDVLDGTWNEGGRLR